ncbi:NAD(P)-dependent oxidoreductase [Salinibacterium sp. G-O1]|uniref:NAD(P)-dependent oxidoreductase n=1 Tax=Salinibacterium sp. G-O1 TaxID=3046208 RepID=UPI0024BBD914|nr:NAD(P)-dependent oxidoreductase [Salinibacterium sp. G-O1]MDJ0336054.1 NAD(P)-dependent oxidoreductase [Salinibacterium sp. G-O1]
MKVLIPNTIELKLPDEYTLVEYAADEPIADGHIDAEVLVVWANSAANLQDAAKRLTSLRLVQTLAAGPDAVLNAGFGAVPVASGRSLHDAPVAEHALALTLALVRRLDTLGDAQRESRWDDGFLTAQRTPETDHLYTLSGAEVLIWGFGSIAATLAPMLELLGARVTGVASTAGTRHGYPVVSTEQLPAQLATTDVLISLLPASPQTRNAFDASLISAMKPTALFVNVGRGATVNETDLMDALRSGRLRAAAIDVMQEEPLPSSSPLWTTPNLIITPHAAGNRPRGASTLVATNLRNLTAGAPLENLV